METAPTNMYTYRMILREIVIDLSVSKFPYLSVLPFITSSHFLVEQVHIYLIWFSS